jgi:hypothetical protein
MVGQKDTESLFTALDNVSFNCVNNALEGSPRSIRRNIWIPTILFRRVKGVDVGNTFNRQTTLACAAFRHITRSPPFPNCRNGIQPLQLVIARPNLIEVLNYLDDGGLPPRIYLEVGRRLDLDKQQGLPMMRDNIGNIGVDGFSRSWNEPLGIDVKIFFRREPIVQNHAIKGKKIVFNGLVIIVQPCSPLQNKIWVVAITPAKD